MAPYSYFAIQFAVDVLYNEKGSKFLSFAYPVDSEADIKEKLKFLKKKYYDGPSLLCLDVRS